MCVCEAFSFVSGLSPAKFEKLCREFKECARPMIVDREDSRGISSRQYQCHWSFVISNEREVKDGTLEIQEFERRAVSMGGEVVRVRVGLHWETVVVRPASLDQNDYFELKVPLTAKDRKNACRGLERALERDMNLTVEFNRDCLDMIASKGTPRFSLVMRLSNKPLKDIHETCRSLMEFLVRWRRNGIRILGKPQALWFVYDSNRQLDDAYA